MLDEIGVSGGWGARPRLGSWVRERGPGGTNLKAKESARVVLGTTGPGHCRCWDSGELGSWSSDAECEAAMIPLAKVCTTRLCIRNL